jgi:GrpB-like predicted nucleotidyltransferase (UPF0157 family)
MHWQALPAIFLGLLPFLLLPAIFAFTGRKRHRMLILGINVLLFVLSAGGIAATGAPLLGVFGSVISWVALLAFALKRDAPAREALDEPVTLAPYDAAWPAAFEAERHRLCEALELAPGAIEHIGSTAVPGLIAKPIVDLMLGSSIYPPLESLVSRLLILGYVDMGEAGVAGRRYFKLREAVSFNLHVVERGGAHWTNNLRLRDYLRRDPAARERYADAKRAALGNGAQLLAYSAAKQPALAALLGAAGAPSR